MMKKTTIVSRVLSLVLSGTKVSLGKLSGYNSRFTVLSQLVPDFKLAYAMVAVYTTLVSYTSSTAAIEAERDEESGWNFTVNANWTNEQISGGISDPVLWGCRRYSDTKRYYRVLYGVLLSSYLMAVTVYILIKFINSLLTFNGYTKLKRMSNAKGYLLNVAQRLKLILNLVYRLENRDHASADLISNQWEEERSVLPRSDM